MSRRRHEITLTAQTSEGFAVAHAGREQYGNNRAPMFSCGVDVYRSRKAWEIGAEPESCGRDGVMIRDHFPELAPIARLSGAWTDNGEPTHAVANGWYRLSGADMAHEIDGLERIPYRKNYYGAPAHRADYDHLSPDFAAYFVDMAARCLRVDPADLPNVQDERLFSAWVDDVARPRWRAEADAANALLDRLAAETPPVVDPSERSEESCSFSLGEGMERISVRAEHDPSIAHMWGETGRERVRYTYRVLVRACGTSYTTRYGGSTADHDAGRHDARGACTHTLSELRDALNYPDGAEWAREMGYETDETTAREYARTVKALDRCVATAERMRAALEANSDAIGG
jgi:hypothetical protein